MNRFILIFIFLLTISKSFSAENCETNSLSQLGDLSELSIRINEVLAFNEPMALRIDGQENELVKVDVYDELIVKKDVDLDQLVKNEAFLSKAFGKGIELQKQGEVNYKAARSILGVEISFDLKLSEVTDDKVTLKASDYSMVFRNSTIKMTTVKLSDSTKIIIHGVSFIKKSSFDKLNSMTLGGAKKFIASQIQNQILSLKNMLIEMYK
jgi:hypothetical protein